MQRFFITAIDTNVGKTVATGLLSKGMLLSGKKVITAKLVQTGCETSIAEDILQHRRIMGIELLQEDIAGLTCPYIFRHPYSPHLAASLEDAKIDLAYIDKTFNKLSLKYDYLLIEGAGGIYVPLNEKDTILSYVISRQIPIFVVTTARLGSINHTLLTVETLLSNKLKIEGIIYNTFFHTCDAITDDTLTLIKKRYSMIDIYRMDKAITKVV